MCCRNERYKTYQMGFSFCHLGHAPGVGLWGAGGAQGGQKYFFQTLSSGISNRRWWRAEQNACKIFILGSIDLGVRSKGQIPFNFGYHAISFFLYQTLHVMSQIKERKHIEQNFHSVAGIMRQGWDLGVLGVKNFSVGICDDTPLTARSS